MSGSEERPARAVARYGATPSDVVQVWEHRPAGVVARYGPLLARLLFAPVLIGYGLLKIRALMGSVQADMLQSFPLTQLLVYLTVAIELIGGVLIVLGWKTRAAATVLVVFYVGVTLLMVPLLGAAGGLGAAYLDQILKNLAFIGGLVLLAVHGAGPVSLDARRQPSTAGR